MVLLQWGREPGEPVAAMGVVGMVHNWGIERA